MKDIDPKELLQMFHDIATTLQDNMEKNSSKVHIASCYGALRTLWIALVNNGLKEESPELYEKLTDLLDTTADYLGLPHIDGN